MAVTTKKLFPATSNATTTVFSPVGIQLNNQDDLDVYVTLSGGTRVLQLRQSTGSTAQSSHPQVNNTDGLYFPAVTAGTTLYNYTLSTDNNTITFNSALPQGAVVFCERRTRDADSSYTTFASGSTIRATDLNNSSTESNFTAQDGRNKALTIEGVLFDGDQPSTNFVTSSHIVDGSIVNADINASADIAGSKLADDSVTLAKLGSGALPTDITVASANIVNGTIIEEDVANSAITANKIADGTVGTLELSNGAVNTAKLAADAVDGTRLADNAVDSEHYTDGSIDRVHLEADIIDSTKLADNAVNSEHYVDGSIDHVHLANDIIDGDNIQDDVIDSEHIATGALDNEHYATGSITSDKLSAATVITESEQATATTNDTSFLTSAAADARFFNISSGDTIKDGQTFPDNDTTIATTAAINDRIIDIVNDVGGFDIVESEQHFPNTNPQGQAGSAAVLSIKAASTNLVPSGTTLTITNGNLANNANITITGVTSTIPTGFGFIVESTSTLHTYTFHRLVPKATEVTTVAGKAVEIGRLGTAAAVEDMSILGTTDVVADMAILGTNDVVADMNLLATSDVVSDMNTLAVADVLSDLSTVADSVTNVNNVGNNITNVNSVSNSAGANQTFTVTVQNVSGNKYFIDGVQNPVLKLARGKTYTFDLSDSSNSNHPLRIRETDNTAYTSGVTVSGTAGSSGATVVFAVPSNAPNSLKYYCSVHGNNMGNTITVIDDNVGTVAGSISNVNTVGGAISNVNTTAGSIANVNTVATNINDINDFTDKYRVGSQNPTTGLDTGDLFFNTTSNSLKVYTGSAWVDGVTATGNFAVTTGNTFTGSNVHNDNVKSLYGTGSDFEIFHASNVSVLKNTAGDQLNVRSDLTWLRNAANSESLAKFTADGSAELYYDNGKKLHTIAAGCQITGNVYVNDGQTFTAGNSNDLQIYHNNSNSYIDNNTGDLNIRGNGDDIFLKPVDTEVALKAIPNGSVELYFDNAKKLETISTGVKITSNSGDVSVVTDSTGSALSLINPQNLNNSDVKFGSNYGHFSVYTGGSSGSEKFRVQHDGNVVIPNDNMPLQIGAGQDLQIYHDGTDSIISHQGATGGDLIIQTTGSDDDVFIKCNDDFIVNVQNRNENAIIGRNSGAVELYYDNSKKFETRSGGVAALGDCRVDSDTGKFLAGLGSDLEMYHNGSHSFIKNNTGTTYLQGPSNLSFIANNKDAIMAVVNAGVSLFYNNVKKFETTSSGVTVTGSITASGGGLTTNGDVQFNSGTTNMNILFDASQKSLEFDDSVKATFGFGRDLQIFHDGSNSYIEDAGTGELRITGSQIVLANTAFTENMITAAQDGAVSLFNDGVVKLATTANGIKVNNRFELRNGVIFDNTANGNNCGLSFNGDGIRPTSGSGADIDNARDLGQTSYRWRNVYAVTYYGDGSNLTGISSVGGANSVSFNDDVRAKFGTGNDLQIYHDGTKSIINEGGTGWLEINTSNLRVQNPAANETILYATENGSVELMYDNSKKFETYASGVTVTGNINVSANIIGNSSHTTELGSYSDGQIKRVRMSQGGEIHFGDTTTSNFIGITEGTVDQFSDQDKLGIYYRNELKLYSNNNNARWIWNASGHYVPNSNNTVDIGTTSNRVRNIYTNDLHLSNEGSSNEVDGTWGDWTMQEGESDLFLKNNRSGKKYKFNLMEVS